uniref:Uncharacterized protein n=1 Tax=Chromera velia CCMP2878 TaxID=1169474 RepID=A0A0G4FSA7_9ALVE|eukprot:Cvel_18520.t1-p1 / transcript=Cvel_18520.t1 / gene=Cvel_18520 / organism=Chromera_velia_CCMP2878 / gene_product=hypothetical protein / transcript_product=hypothetical protein / location=Cvel_scaffold1539:2047-3284(+) / protein_length=312 / sequence_SO=supercontig / SO=protein_coding / is_pseudo=false
MDCLQHFYLSPFLKRLRARWSEIKSFAPLAKESALAFVACRRKILGHYRRLVPTSPEAFSIMEYSILFKALPIGSAAYRDIHTLVFSTSALTASGWVTWIPPTFKNSRFKKEVDVKLATVSFTATAAETIEDSLEDPHFGKDDGATVDAVGENYLKRLPSSMQYTVSPFSAPVPVQTAGEDGAVVQTTHSVDVPDVMFGEKCADLSFFMLSDSPVPFFFFKALAQHLGAMMDYRSDLMTIFSAFGDPMELFWINLGRYYAMTLRQAPVFEASPAISITLSPAACSGRSPYRFHGYCLHFCGTPFSGDFCFQR